MCAYIVEPQLAKWLRLIGESVTGKKDEELGLVWKPVPAEGLGAEGTPWARIPWELLSANKSIVNKAMECKGRSTLQFLAAETDAIAH